MRLFIAIDLAEPVRSALAEVQERLAHTRAAVRWVSPSHYHITVKFLGETDDALLPQIAARLSRAAEQAPPVALEVEGLDRLPLKGQPRAIIAHALSRDHHLTRLHRLIDSGIGGLGLPMDTRELLPHLTLGRVSSNHGLNKLLRLLPKYEFHPFGRFDVTELRLYRSTLGAAGPGTPPRYDRLHSAKMAAVPDDAGRV